MDLLDQVPQLETAQEGMSAQHSEHIVSGGRRLSGELIVGALTEVSEHASEGRENGRLSRREMMEDVF